jgi:hypothetical protein
MSYKRNQIEEAIARISISKYEKPPPELCSRIKRLLELGRSLGRKLRSKDAEEANFGFFSEGAPGTGADILFSEYEARAIRFPLRSTAPTTGVLSEPMAPSQAALPRCLCACSSRAHRR